MINWIRENKESLSIRGIERQLKMPDSTLIKAVNGSQGLPKKWIEPLSFFINNLKNCKRGGEIIKTGNKADTLINCEDKCNMHFVIVSVCPDCGSKKYCEKNDLCGNLACKRYA